VRTRSVDLHTKIFDWLWTEGPSGHLIRDEKGRPYDWGAAGQRFYKAFMKLVSDAGLRHISPCLLERRCRPGWQTAGIGKETAQDSSSPPAPSSTSANDRLLTWRLPSRLACMPDAA
jgi:hypothetical protein